MVTRVSRNVVRVSKKNLSDVRSIRADRDLSITLTESAIDARRFHLPSFMREKGRSLF